MELRGSAGDRGDRALPLHRRRDREAALELAAAAALRLAAADLLAGAWAPGAVPDPLRRNGAPRLRPLPLPPAHPRGARAHPARHARALRLWPGHPRKKG